MQKAVTTLSTETELLALWIIANTSLVTELRCRGCSICYKPSGEDRLQQHPDLQMLTLRDINLDTKHSHKGIIISTDVDRKCKQATSCCTMSTIEKPRSERHFKANFTIYCSNLAIE